MSVSRSRLSLVRHGQSESNVSGRWQGHGDSDLSPLGREQAQALATRLRSWQLGRFWASDLVRAADTGRASAAEHNAKILYDDALREIDVGRWEGLSRPEVAERFPEEIAAINAGQIIPIGGGESWADLARRACAAVAQRAQELRDGEHGIIFSHGGFIASYVAATFAISRDKPRRLGNVANTSVTTIEFEDGKPRLIRFNDTTHLAPLGSWGQERIEEKGATAIALTPWDGDAEGPEPDVETYALGELPGESLSVDDPKQAVQALVARHPKARVALRLPPDACLELVEDCMGSRGVLGVSRGTSHVIVHDGQRTMADINTGD